MTSAQAQNHVRIVSLLTLAEGVLGLLPALLMVLISAGLMSGAAFGGSPGDLFLAGGIMGLIALFFLCLALPALIAGFGLLARKPWARTLTLVIAVINLFGFPFGTALGAYQLWVLAMNEETVAAYRNPELAGAREYV